MNAAPDPNVLPALNQFVTINEQVMKVIRHYGDSVVLKHKDTTLYVPNHVWRDLVNEGHVKLGGTPDDERPGGYL